VRGRPVRLAARDLTIAYPAARAPALNGVSLEVPPGACLLVVGPSGSGKSTLALAVAGLVPREVPASFGGSLTVDGIETRAFEPAALAAAVGVVFQDPESQLVMERVEDDVAFGLENRAWPLSRMRSRVSEAMAQAGLTGLEYRRTNRLSGGQQQRVALAGALAPEPGCLVLDEPTANLDPDGARALFERLAEIRSARGATIVLIEHHVDEAWALADLVLALDGDGAQIDAGEPAAVLARSGERIAKAGAWLPGERGRGVAATPGPGRTRAASSRPVVAAEHVGFAYEPGAPVLRDASLVVEAAERVALLGANGSGKSTLARLLVGLLRPDAGHVRLAGRDPARMPPAVLARRAAYVFQDPERGFLADRVADEVVLGLSPAERQAAPGLMHRLGLPLEEFGERSPYRLSGGEKRRLSLACALVRSPELLVLDEPTYGQDRHGVEGLTGILDDHVERGAALVLASHDRAFVDRVATRVVRVEGGRVVDAGAPRPLAASA